MRAFKIDERQRIAAAERAAQMYLATLPTETVESLGVASILSDLTHEFLLNGIPSDEEVGQLALLAE